MEPTDHELLATFRARKCEQSFRQLVTRHAAMVFATARRITGDPHRAEEISQAVFLLLAGKAGEISDRQPVAGWLYHTTRHRSLDFLRSEARRLNREQIAADMQSQENDHKPNELAGELEAALDAMSPDERDVLVIRYLEDRQLRDVGSELGISEQAAQKRVARALEKLRGIFGQRGVTLTSGALATMLAGEAAAVVPAGLISTATASAVGAVATTTAATIAAAKATSTMTTLYNLKTTAVVLGVAAVTGTTTFLVTEHEADRWQTEYQTLNQDFHGLSAEQERALATIKLRDDQIATLKKDVADLPRLRGEMDALHRQLAELEKIKARYDELAQAGSAGGNHESAMEPTADNLTIEFAPGTPKMFPPLKRLGVGIKMYEMENNGWFPTADELSKMMTEVASAPNVSPDEVAGSGNIVFEFHGNIEDIPARERNGTILARQADYTVGPDHRWERAYLFVDGSVRSHSEESLEELTAWENERIFPPEHQSRRP